MGAINFFKATMMNSSSAIARQALRSGDNKKIEKALSKLDQKIKNNQLESKLINVSNNAYNTEAKIGLKNNVALANDYRQNMEELNEALGDTKPNPSSRGLIQKFLGINNKNAANKHCDYVNANAKKKLSYDNEIQRLNGKEIKYNGLIELLKKELENSNPEK